MEGLALGVELNERQPWHTRSRWSVATALDLSLATAWVLSAATAWGASAATAGFRLRQQRGALDMLHSNEEHGLKSLHVD